VQIGDGMVVENNFLGVGIYTVPEAARITSVARRRIRRWVQGYTFKISGQARRSAPVWHSQLPRLAGQVAIGFLDLIEIRFVDAFLNHGVSWPTIRMVETRARELFRSNHPFATRNFRTDGRTLFVQVSGDAPEEPLLDIAKSQFAFEQVIAPHLKGLEFSGTQAARWWPLGEQRRVVLDPQRCFGQPIVNREGVPTSVLASAAAVEESHEAVARYFKVDRQSVRDAVEFEKLLAA
jgi:uncharacterized protein (DUF433 family)